MPDNTENGVKMPEQISGQAPEQMPEQMSEQAQAAENSVTAESTPLATATAALTVEPFVEPFVVPAAQSVQPPVQSAQSPVQSAQPAPVAGRPVQKMSQLAHRAAHSATDLVVGLVKGKTAHHPNGTVSGAPNMGGIPGTPGIPGIPGIPERSATSDIPGLPSNAGDPASAAQSAHAAHAVSAANAANAAGPEGAATGPQRALSLFDPVEVLRGGMMAEDLPFANEVDAALARRPLRKERYLSMAVGGGVLLFILWAAFAYIDEVTHAEGQVISSQRTQAIQNLEGGILRNVLVSEGQTVEKGDVLAQLDNEMAASSYRDAINKALDNTLAIIRLEAELKRELPKFPENVELWVQDVVGAQNLAAALPQAHQAIKDQMAAFQARTTQQQSELKLLDSQYQQRMHEVGELTARKRQTDESLALAVEQRDISAGLLQKRSTSRVDYLNQQQRVVQLAGEVEALASTIPKAQSAAEETSQRMTFRKAEIDATVTDELNKRRMDLASLNETLAAGGDRVTRTELRSPVRGTVKRIVVTTLGGVVKPGESIMEIVPLDDTLLVEAKVRPADVAFLRSGQKAMVKVSAYDFSIYGGLEGVLEQISADTIEDKRGDFFYLVKVRTNKTAIQHQDKSLPIIPGMMATVDILIGKKTVLDYLLKPILKARDRALRER